MTLPASALALPKTPTSKQRFFALDVFRGLAILSMIQGHTFTVLLHPNAYGAAWLPWYTLLHGLTAPMFLVGGGLAYGFVRLRPSHDRFSIPSTRILKRAVQLLAIGYLLQLPRAPLSELWARPDLLQGLLKVGPLQLVSVCLFLLEGLRAITNNRRHFLRMLAASTLTISAAAPFVWKLRASTGALLPVGTWLDGYAGSLFPFFPWSVFFFAGVLVSGWITRGDGIPQSKRPMAWLLGLSLLCSALAYTLFVHGEVLRGIYGEHELWHTSPLYVGFRAGLAFAFLALLWAAEPFLRWLWQRSSWIDPVFGTLSRQSLVAYVAHLLILYGTPLTTGLIKLGTTMSLFEATLTFAFVLSLTTSLCVLWDHFITAGRLRAKLRSTLSPLPLRVGNEIDGIGER